MYTLLSLLSHAILITQSNNKLILLVLKSRYTHKYKLIFFYNKIKKETKLLNMDNCVKYPRKTLYKNNFYLYRLLNLEIHFYTVIIKYIFYKKNLLLTC